MIAPHGGKLVHRVLAAGDREAALAGAEDLPVMVVSEEAAADARNLARGVLSPLDGFVGKQQLESIIETERLPDGTIFPIPPLLTVQSRAAVEEGARVLLCSEAAPQRPFALLTVSEVFRWDSGTAALSVFGTDEIAHPGVESYHTAGDYAVGGTVDLLDDYLGPFAAMNLSPAETRRTFEQRGWRTVCAFQTRNVPHAGHEELQKMVLGLVDGLLIQPVIGKKKPGDFRDEVIVAACHALIEGYFHPGRVLLGILPTRMLYAGPKEAILHGIMRKNYGCSHIIIGRDHAGVDGYYGEDEAIEKFESMASELEIVPITIRGDFRYCRICGRVTSDRTCPHQEDACLQFSGTELRAMIARGVAPPPEIMRAEVFEAVRRFDEPFVQ